MKLCTLQLTGYGELGLPKCSSHGCGCEIGIFEGCKRIADTFHQTMQSVPVLVEDIVACTVLEYVHTWRCPEHARGLYADQRNYAASRSFTEMAAEEHAIHRQPGESDDQLRERVLAARRNNPIAWTDVFPLLHPDEFGGSDY